jgi:uncharacterized membrane protein
MNRPRRDGTAPVVLATLELLALAVWTGGLIVIIAVVIPAVFNSLGMEPGGRFLTRLFKGYDRAVMAAIAVLVLIALLRLWLREDGVPIPGSELLVLGAMIVIAAGIGFIWGPETVALQERAFAAQSEAEKKEALEAFFRTHSLVRALYILNLCLGIALTAVKLKNLMKSRPEHAYETSHPGIS